MATFPDGRPILWRNVFHEPVDIENIDKEYALNILTMVLLRRGRYGSEFHEDIRTDPLVQTLRKTVLNGRERDESDKPRSILYNERCQAEALPFRANV